LSQKEKNIEVGLRYIKPRKLLVEILAFCLMPNHFHLMVRQKVENGITEFMRKMGTGYTNYFNKKHERVGSLFQGKYKVVHIQNERHFVHLPFYIHFNPLDLVESEWRNGRIKNFEKTAKFLENYRWSSYLDYIGKKNFSSVTQRNFLLENFNGPEHYKKQALLWLKDVSLEEMSDLLLE